MTALSMPQGDLFSLITIADPGARRPSWKMLLGLPGTGEAHLDLTPHSQRSLWAARLDRAVMQAEKPVLLLASGAACHAAAWWARLSPEPYVARVAGALLFDPPEQRGSFESPRIALPFPSAVVGRDAQASALAAAWGSGLLELPRAGRRRDTWQHAHELLLRATAGIVERRMRVAEALGAPIEPRALRLVPKD